MIGQPDLDRRWWMLEDDDEIGSSLVKLVEELMQKSHERRCLLEAWRCMYVDEPMPSDAPASAAFERSMRTRWPALRSGVDSIHSRIAKSRPRVQVVTIDGDYELQTRAENLTTYGDGEFERLNAYELGERCFLDCEVYGDGWVYVYEKYETVKGELTGRTCYERVYPGNMFVDPREAEYDCIRSRYMIRWVDRDVLAEAYPKHAEKIRQIKTPDATLRKHTRGSDDSNAVLVVEGWRLPVSKANPGKHVIAVDDCVLLNEEWKDETFPFARVQWARDPAGDHGISLVAQMAGPQRELDEFAEVEHDTRSFFVPSMWLQSASEVAAEEITNGTGLIYKTNSVSPPTMFDPTSTLLNMQRVVDVMIERVHNLAGVSVLSAQSEKPAGITSGVALNSLHNIESERFAMASRSYERFFVDLAKQTIASAERLVRKGVSPKMLVTYGDKDDSMSEVTFEDARFDERPYQIRTFLSSSLSQQPAAKMEEVTMAINAGWVDKEDGGELLGFPDFKRHTSIVAAGRKHVKQVVEKALRKGIATAPDPYMPLSYLLKYGTLAREDAARKGCPQAHLRVLEDMLGAAEQMLASMTPPPMPGAPGQGAPGAPMAPSIPAMPAGPSLAVVPPGA